MDQQNEVYLHNEIGFGHRRKNGVLIQATSWMILVNTKLKKQVIKDHISYDFIYKKCLE